MGILGHHQKEFLPESGDGRRRVGVVGVNGGGVGGGLREKKVMGVKNTFTL